MCAISHFSQQSRIQDSRSGARSRDEQTPPDRVELASMQDITNSLSEAPLQQLPDLPEAAVACILQHVPLRRRLARCALVCRAWAAAALLVPAQVDIELKSSENCVQLQDWLAKHGGVVVALTAHFRTFNLFSSPTLQLPVPKFIQLRSLELSKLSVQPLALEAATSNTVGRIVARQPSHIGPSGSSSSTTAAGTVAAAAAAVLPQLQQLTLTGCFVPVPLLSQLLSATTLTALHFVDFRNNSRMLSSIQGQFSAAVWEQLEQLPQLSELHWKHHQFTAADIAPLSKLQHLQHLSLDLDGSFRWGSLQPEELPTALQHLTQLRHLQLYYCELYRILPRPLPNGQYRDGYRLLSALTASTQLTALVLVDSPQPVPRPAFAHMFPTGCLLPHLKVLHLHGAPWLGSPRWGCVDAAQIPRIAASCPALQELTLHNVTPEDFDEGCLAQLPGGVTSVDGLGWSRPAA